MWCPRCGAELAARFKGEWWSTDEACADCGVTAADPPQMLAPSDDEVAYTLDEWSPGERATVTESLAQSQTLYRWEGGLVLVVPLSAEHAVDGLLDDVEDAADEAAFAEAAGPDDGSEAVQEAMADLFVAADRLQHSPSDIELSDDLLATGDVVTSSTAPFGIEPQVWQRAQALARDVVANVQAGAPEDTISDACRALREFLRPYV